MWQAAVILLVVAHAAPEKTPMSLTGFPWAGLSRHERIVKPHAFEFDRTLMKKWGAVDAKAFLAEQPAMATKTR
jgi:hypothetical protein